MPKPPCPALATALVAFAVLLLGGIDARAQTSAEMTGLPVDLNGVWSVNRLPENEDLGPCVTRDSRNLPRLGCRFNVEKLNITARARAWMQFTDEALEGKFFCIPEPIPSMLTRNLPQRIEQRKDRVIITYDQRHHIVTRTAWTDGRSLPDWDEVAYFGHSIGRYEGNELVVETRNFTFDPSGIDTQSQVPSSWQKRLIERYSRVGPDKLKMVLTIEDPVFLKTPYTETFDMVKAEAREDAQLEWYPCDFEDASLPLKMLPPKYVD
jgi:hypothetical protein